MMDSNPAQGAVKTVSESRKQDSEIADSLGAFAHKASQKHFKKTVKYKSHVLKDTDPEPLHQMRVGIRRLRSALETFDAAIDLTGASLSRQRLGKSDFEGSRHLAKLAKRLGAVRDMDVLLMWLQSYCQDAELTDREQRALTKVQKRLTKKRRKAFDQMCQWLNGRQYRTLTARFKAWIDEPCYRALAQVPIQLVLPDLLLPLLSEVLQHPGWLVGTIAQSGGIVPDTNMDRSHINRCLAKQGFVLHDLRKRIKHVRYQAEFFLNMYDLPYAAQIKEFRQLQDILGALQDEVVISVFLSETLGATWSERLPALAEQFERERLALWRQWQQLQAHYLDVEFRHTLRLQVISPVADGIGGHLH